MEIAMNIEPIDSASGAATANADSNSQSVHSARRASRGFPSSYAALTPIGKSSWLAGEECAELVQSRQLRPEQVQAEARRLRKSAARIAAIVPSPAWLETFWHGHPFPPAGVASPMRRAAIVLDKSERPVLWPANYLSGNGATYDVIIYETECRRAALELKPSRGESSSESPSARALEAAEAAGAIIDTGVKLLTEDEQVLKQQIDRYLAGKNTTLLDPDQR
jgi:hypothetical protein